MPDYITGSEVATAIKGVLGPVLDRLGDLEARAYDGAGHAKPPAQPPPFPFGNSATSRGPAYLKSGRGEAPLSFTAILKSLQSGNKSLAPLAWDLSQKLINAGYIQTDPRSIVLPIGGNCLVRTPGHEADVEEIARICKGAFVYDCDLDELAVVTKQMRGAYETKAPQDSGDDTLGGAWIPPAVLGEPIGLLRPLSVVMAAGARNVPVPPGGTTAYPRQTGDPQFFWTPPNTAITESNVNTGVVILGQKKLAAIIKVPNECFRWSSGLAESVIRLAMASKLALSIDLACLEGTGGQAQPTGLVNLPLSAANVPAADKVTKYEGAGVGVNGNTFKAEDPLLMASYIEEANDAAGPTAYLMRPLYFAALANKRADAVTVADGAGPFLFPITRGAMSNAVEKMLCGVDVRTTTQISKTRTKGGGSGLTYVVCGNFRNYLVAVPSTIELLLSYEAGYGSDQTWARCIGFADAGPAHAESFVLADQLLAP